MRDDLDRYESYYADRLWNLLPEIYRVSDSDSFDRDGPLRELCERIGAQMAVVRRSIDRLWEDQSIESCDDWVVPYIGDLLATNLVSGLDTRGRRLEVANTIYYRRRKGTAAVLEQLAGDVTGWDVRVVEFFRRLARTRHGLDPEIGLPSATLDPLGARRLQLASGLIGPLTGTTIGGTADLRNAFGASNTGTAFDEFFYTPDSRRGEGATGRYNIPRLGVFLWRLYSFPESAADPNLLLSVPVAGLAPCAAHYTFDPTGRQVPLFASASRTTDLERFGATWVSPSQWELPGPIPKPLLDDDRRSDKEHPDLYTSKSGADLTMRSLGIFRDTTADLVALDDARIWPELGRFAVAAADPKLRVWYHYGFASRIGAGAYDRRAVAGTLAATPAPATSVSGGGAIGAIPGTGTVTLEDSLTYTAIPDVAAVKDLTIRSANGVRPLIRRAPASAAWTLTGQAGSILRLEGLFLSGGDIVLAGEFDEVAISFSTFDPGSAAAAGAPSPYAKSIDDRELRPTTLWIDGKVRALTIDRSVTGPIRARHGGGVVELTLRDSIVQTPVIQEGGETVSIADFKDLESFAMAVKDAREPAAEAIRNALAPGTKSLLNLLHAGARISDALANALIADVNNALQKPDLFDPQALRRSAIPRRILQSGSDAAKNRAFLADSFPLELADLALAFVSGDVRLQRTTILGRMYVHRTDVSESILNDLAWAENPQQGCVRFSAWTAGSVLPRKYESVEIVAQAALFTSRSFGQPGYAQLRSDADEVARPGAGGIGAISEGAENGSEMGAFQGELASIKERSLQIKFEEFMPVGLVPVVVHVT